MGFTDILKQKNRETTELHKHIDNLRQANDYLVSQLEELSGKRQYIAKKKIKQIKKEAMRIVGGL